MMRRLLIRALVCSVAVLPVACDRKSPGADAHAGQGQEITADPTFEIKLRIPGGSELVFPVNELGVYQARPPKDAQPMKQQTFELAGEKFSLGGTLPADFKLAPARTFNDLVGKPLTIRQLGGDPASMSMSKITTADGRTYLALNGTLTVEKAFYRKQQYAGVSGRFEVNLQEIELGDPDKPGNQGDKPVGDPVKAEGTFTSRADSYEYQSL